MNDVVITVHKSFGDLSTYSDFAFDYSGVGWGIICTLDEDAEEIKDKVKSAARAYVDNFLDNMSKEDKKPFVVFCEDPKLLIYSRFCFILSLPNDDDRNLFELMFPKQFTIRV